MSTTPSQVLGVIPARWGSTRFPGKPLHLIAGKPLVQHVWERCRECPDLQRILIATDDDRIADFDLKLIQIEGEHMEIPEQHHKVTAKLPSVEFQKICRDLKEFGETMQIKASKDGITFSVQGVW